MQDNKAEFARSETDRMVTGISGGLAKYFGIDVWIIRLAFIFLTLLAGGTGIIVYLVLLIFMKRTPTTSSPFEDMQSKRDNGNQL